MARYGGKKGVVYMAAAGTGTATNTLGLSKWSIDMPTDKVDVSGFTDANKQYVDGLGDCKGAFSGTWDNTETKLYSGSRSSDGVKLYLYPSASATGYYFYGPAWLDFSMDCDLNGKVSVSCNWVAAGDWGAIGI